MLKDWDERTDERHDVQAIAGRINARFADYNDGTILAFPPPPIVELGNATGFDVVLQDRAGLGHATFMEVRNQLLDLARREPDADGGASEQPGRRTAIQG